MTQLQKQFIKDLKDAIISNSIYHKKLLLFSGGIDSLTLLCLLLEIYPKKQLDLITIIGIGEKDRKIARQTAEYFGLTNKEYFISFDDIINSIDVIKGTNINGFHDGFYYIFLYLLFTKNKIKDYDIFWGEGADSLYGSTGIYTYRGAKELAIRDKISIDEALIIRKKENYLASSKKPTTKLVSKLVAKNNNNLILPFKDKRLHYLLDASLKEIKPETKGFIKEILKEKYNLPDDLLQRQRLPMQEGTGYFDMFEQYLLKEYSYLSKSPVHIIRKLTHQIPNKTL